MHWQYTTCHHLLFFKQRSHPMIEKQSQSQRHKSGWWDPPCIRVSLNSFISSISLHWQDTCRFSKNKSSHDIAIKVDDKTHFSWPCREGPPACCAFSVPILAVLATAVFFQFPFPGVIENAFFVQFPFPGVIENAVFFHFLVFSACEVLCFSSSLSLSQFPSSSLPSSLRGFPVFFQESRCNFFKEKTKMFCGLKQKNCNALSLEKHRESAKGTGKGTGRGNWEGNCKGTGRELGKRKGTGKTQDFARTEEKEVEKHSVFNHALERELDKKSIFNHTREGELEKHSIFNHAQERGLEKHRNCNHA